MRPSELMPLRVAWLMDHPSRHLQGLLDALAVRRDLAVKAVSFGRAAPSRRWGMAEGLVPVEHVPGVSTGRGLYLNPGIGAVVRRQRCDIWVVNSCYNSPSTLLAVAAINRMGMPWVYLNEALRPRGTAADLLRHAAMRRLLRHASGVAGTGGAAREWYRRVTRGSVISESLPYLEDLSAFLELPGAITPAEGGRLEFVALSALTRGKGLHSLVEACTLLPSEGWRVTVYGEGESRRSLERAITAAGLDDAIRLEGSIPFERRHEAFLGKHVFVLPSRWDGWGMVVPEAMAAGLPVITTERVASSEFVSPENGFIVPVDSPAALAGRMEWFLRNRERIAAMGTMARRALGEYRADTLAARTAEFLAQVVAGRPPAAAGKRAPCCAVARRAVRGTAIRVGAALAHTVLGGRILVYHNVMPADRQRFAGQCAFLKDHFTVVSPRELLVRWSRGDAVSDLVAVTFDDGFRVTACEAGEALAQTGIHACFFVPTGFCDLAASGDSWRRFALNAFGRSGDAAPLGEEDIRALVAAGHEIGSHGVSHTSFAAMPGPGIARELAVSRERVGAWTGMPPTLCAYPYGEWKNPSADVAKLLDEAGYAFGLTIRRGRLGAATNRWFIPREHAEGCWPVSHLRFFLARRGGD